MQKTAYELRISDCSSDVCSADLLDRGRSFGAAIHKFGALIGRTINWIEQNIFGGKAPWSIRDLKKDHETLKLAKDSEKIIYPKPDGKLSFDKLSSVFVSSTNHEEDQPVHLQLKDPAIPIAKNLPMYDEPAPRYCPAGVYEEIGRASCRERVCQYV